MTIKDLKWRTKVSKKDYRKNLEQETLKKTVQKELMSTHIVKAETLMRASQELRLKVP